MATASLNDIKVRLLQLKGMGYDKMLHQKELTNELDILATELEAIANEIPALMAVINDAEAAQQMTEHPPETNQGDGKKDTGQTNQVTENHGSHVTVDQTQLTNILSPKSNAGKTKVKKTTHTIGRRD